MTVTTLERTSNSEINLPASGARVGGDTHHGPDRRWKSVVLRGILDLLFAVLTKREVTGLDNLPSEGPCLLVFNHLSNFDPPLIFTLLRRPDVTGLVAAGYRRRALHRLLIEAAGGTWLRRGESDRAALQAALRLLDHGWMVGIAPEGGRSRTQALGPGKPGPAFLALHANVPIVPVGLENTEHLGNALLHLRRIPLTVRIGEPFRLPSPQTGNRKAHLHACTEIIMCHIAALLAPRYRGVYADHPQLDALVNPGRGGK